MVIASSAESPSEWQRSASFVPWQQRRAAGTQMDATRYFSRQWLSPPFPSASARLDSLALVYLQHHDERLHDEPRLSSRLSPWASLPSSPDSPERDAVHIFRSSRSLRFSLPLPSPLGLPLASRPAAEPSRRDRDSR